MNKYCRASNRVTCSVKVEKHRSLDVARLTDCFVSWGEERGVLVFEKISRLNDKGSQDRN